MEEIFEIIFEEFPEAIFVAEIDTGIIIYANKSAEKLLGLPKEKLIGIHQSQLHPSEDTIYYKKVFEEDTSVRANYPKKKKIPNKGFICST
jgi:PAS domain S-box-containing protein